MRSSARSPWPASPRTLGTLIASGVPILQAIEITGQRGRQRRDRGRDGATCVESVKEGQSIAGPLGVRVFPPMVTQMIAVGEETGSLDAMLGKIADFYEDEVSASQVADLDPRADPDALRGRHRRYRRDLHVPADLLGKVMSTIGGTRPASCPRRMDGRGRM